MLTKDQALAAMDAHIIRVETERLRRLERRVSFPRRLYPVLRQLPLEAIPDLMDRARRYAMRQWTLYLAAAGVLAVTAWFLLFRPWLGFGSFDDSIFLPWYSLSMAALALTIHLHIRAFLNREVPLQPHKSQD